jgi:hypothetical protein
MACRTGNANSSESLFGGHRFWLQVSANGALDQRNDTNSETGDHNQNDSAKGFIGRLHVCIQLPE